MYKRSYGDDLPQTLVAKSVSRYISMTPLFINAKFGTCKFMNGLIFQNLHKFVPKFGSADQFYLYLFYLYLFYLYLFYLY